MGGLEVNVEMSMPVQLLNLGKGTGNYQLLGKDKIRDLCDPTVDQHFKPLSSLDYPLIIP